jgi:ketosteroid isomerase-like protein
MATKKASPAKPTAKAKMDPGLLRAHKAYEAAINSNETNRVMAMYDKDAEIFQPGIGIVSGRRSIRKWVNDYFKAYTTRWKKVALKNFVMGEYGFDEGLDTSVDISRKDGTVTRSKCKGILIYKKQKNGEWLIFRDIWNSNV